MALAQIGGKPMLPMTSSKNRRNWLATLSSLCTNMPPDFMPSFQRAVFAPEAKKVSYILAKQIVWPEEITHRCATCLPCKCNARYSLESFLSLYR
jgi:hypothetical protein